RKLHAAVRGAERKYRRPIGILADLQGPKFRIGAMDGGQQSLAAGQTFEFDGDQTPGDTRRVQLPHPEMLAALAPGHQLLLDDGKLRMEVIEAAPNRIRVKVLVGGALSSRKGVAAPDTIIPVPPLTEKDRADLDFMLSLGIDWLALSFVQRGVDIAPVREIVGSKAAIMAKIEKPSAIADLPAIVAAVDGVMVARGDLGVEMPVETVPGLQKQITRLARAAGKPVVVATQMLESMINAPTPTRAEVSDVATAVFDGADAIMLSAESAVGKYPAEAVTMMDRIVFEAERDPTYPALVHATQTPPLPTAPDAIAAAARAIADTVKLSAIVCYTATGSTALRVARERPNLPVVGVTPIPATGRRLAIVWGVHAVLTSDPEDLSDMVKKATQIAFKEGFASPSDGILITAGVPLGSAGTTNMVRIAFLNERGEPMASGD
ncbi:MAG: pyruvate kinase, partial [Pseudomonadota bacterium]